jgi:hypothetical protein
MLLPAKLCLVTQHAIRFQAFPADLLVHNYFTFDNASNWLDLDAFMAWLSASYQSAMKPVNPITLCSSLPLPAPSASGSTQRSQTGPLPSSRRGPALSSSIPIEISDDSDTDRKPLRKRKRKTSSVKLELGDQDIVDLASEDSSGSNCKTISTKSWSRRSVNGKQKAKYRRQSSDRTSDVEVGRIRITRQLTSMPSCWTVPRPGAEIVYLLDLSDDAREWKDAKGEFLSMAAIIKSQVRNAVFNFKFSTDSKLIVK